MTALCLPTLLVSLLAGADPAAAPGPREIRGTELIVQEALDELGAPEGDVSLQPSETLSAAFPGYLFVLATFLDTPAGELPEPLTPRNLFAVSPDGEARHLAATEDLLALFEDAFDPVKTAEDAKRAAAAALALESAKFPEQPFTPPELTATPNGDGGFDVSGASQPDAGRRKGGGKGPISINFSVGSGGRPSKIVTKNEFNPAPRRRRPVTADDIAADQPAAQRAAGGAPVTNINAPTINKTLTGNTFFKSPSSGNPGGGKNGKGNNGGVVAVDPDGKPTRVGDNVALARYVRKQFGKVTNAKDAKSLMESYLTLATGNFANVEFAPVDEKDIVVKQNSDGGLTVTGKVFAKGDTKKNFHAKWTFDANGKFAAGSHGNRGLNKG